MYLRKVCGTVDSIRPVEVAHRAGATISKGPGVGLSKQEVWEGDEDGGKPDDADHGQHGACAHARLERMYYGHVPTQNTHTALWSVATKA